MHLPCQKPPTQKFIATCWFCSGFFIKIFYENLAWMLLLDKIVQRIWLKQEKRNKINMLPVGQNCPAIGQNCPEIEYRSKTDRWSQFHASMVPSTGSINWWRDKHPIRQKTIPSACSIVWWRIGWTTSQWIGLLSKILADMKRENFFGQKLIDGEVLGPCEGWRRRETSPILPQTKFLSFHYWTILLQMCQFLTFRAERMVCVRGGIWKCPNFARGCPWLNDFQIHVVRGG